MARPTKELDRNVFEGLCRIQCTEREICAVLDVTDKTLNAWCKRTYGTGFSDTYKKHSEVGKISLRRAQYKAAENGNTTMLVWLGKQYLGQADKIETRAEDLDALIEKELERIATASK